MSTSAVEPASKTACSCIGTRPAQPGSPDPQAVVPAAAMPQATRAAVNFTDVQFGFMPATVSTDDTAAIGPATGLVYDLRMSATATWSRYVRHVHVRVVIADDQPLMRAG